MGDWGSLDDYVTCPGLANKLMEGLEEISDGKNCYFVDLFVRVSNKIAINFYHKLGYTVYRTVLQVGNWVSGLLRTARPPGLLTSWTPDGL